MEYFRSLKISCSMAARESEVLMPPKQIRFGKVSASFASLFKSRPASRDSSADVIAMGSAISGLPGTGGGWYRPRTSSSSFGVTSAPTSTDDRRNKLGSGYVR